MMDARLEVQNGYNLRCGEDFSEDTFILHVLERVSSVSSLYQSEITLNFRMVASRSRDHQTFFFCLINIKREKEMLVRELRIT